MTTECVTALRTLRDVIVEEPVRGIDKMSGRAKARTKLAKIADALEEVEEKRYTNVDTEAELQSWLNSIYEDINRVASDKVPNKQSNYCYEVAKMCHQQMELESNPITKQILLNTGSVLIHFADWLVLYPSEI